jgi:hypothetical protein
MLPATTMNIQTNNINNCKIYTLLCPLGVVSNCLGMLELWNALLQTFSQSVSAMVDIDAKLLVTCYSTHICLLQSPMTRKPCISKKLGGFHLVLVRANPAAPL